MRDYKYSYNIHMEATPQKISGCNIKKKKRRPEVSSQSTHDIHQGMIW